MEGAEALAEDAAAPAEQDRIEAQPHPLPRPPRQQRRPRPRDLPPQLSLISPRIFPVARPFSPGPPKFSRNACPITTRTTPTRIVSRSDFMQLHLHPQPRKIIQTPAVMVILYEAQGGVRQIFTDGRPSPPADVQPWWYGYSNRQVGRRHPGGHHHRIPRRRLARRRRHSPDQHRQDDRTLPPPQLRHPRHRDHRRRSARLYQAVHGQGDASASCPTRT